MIVPETPKAYQRIIFLDFDGVLRVRPNPRAQREWSRQACENLQELLKAVPDANLVISSSWRENRPLPELRAILAAAGIDPTCIVGTTPKRLDGCRVSEIRDWLEQNPTHHHVALDDNPMPPAVGVNSIHVDFRRGLTARDCQYVLTSLHCGEDAV
jgi:hypothetical protein